MEDAILDAAWLEISERGYPSLTLEGVAKRAGTSRPVLYRRWKSRSALAVAALARYVALHPIDAPDLGNVRDELVLFMRRLSDRARPDMVTLMFDMHHDLSSEHSSLADVRGQVRARNAFGDVMRVILERGIERGEIAADCLTPRIVALPTDLVRHDILMTSAPISDEAIAEIVDHVFLPLVRRA